MKKQIFNWEGKTLVATGKTTATTSDKLVDATGGFVEHVVAAGMGIINDTDTTYATVSAVDSKTTLSVAPDLFEVSELYSIYKDGDVMVWDESSDIIVTYQIGEASRGTPVGAVLAAGTQWLTLGTVVAASLVSGVTSFIDLGGATNFVPSSHIRFQFDDGTTQKVSGWIPIDFSINPVFFCIINDLVNAIGITAWIEGT